MMDTRPIKAFTIEYRSGISKFLKSEVVISSEGNTTKGVALWDTGATGTCISTNVVKKLGLVPTGMMDIQTPSGKSRVNTYLVTIKLPNDLIIPDVKVCDTAIGEQGIEMLIGMDIITKGDLAVSNYNSRTVFTFRVPSVSLTDYVKLLRARTIAGTHGKGTKKRRR